MSNDKGSMWDRMKLTLAVLGQPVGEDQFEAQIDRAIRSTDEKIKRSNEDATAAKATRIHAHRQVLDTKSKQKALESQAIAFLQSKQQQQAQTLAFEISKLSEDRAEWEDTEAAAKDSERTEAMLIDVLEGQLRRLKHQLGVLRAAANLQRTQEALATNSTPPVIASAVSQITTKKARFESPQQVMTRLKEVASNQAKPKPKPKPKSKSKSKSKPSTSTTREQK